MPLSTEPIVSIPRPPASVAVAAMRPGDAPDADHDAAVRDTIARFEATDPRIVGDGERMYKNRARVPASELASRALGVD